MSFRRQFMSWTFAQLVVRVVMLLGTHKLFDCLPTSFRFRFLIRSTSALLLLLLACLIEMRVTISSKSLGTIHCHNNSLRFGPSRRWCRSLVGCEVKTKTELFMYIITKLHIICDYIWSLGNVHSTSNRMLLCDKAFFFWAPALVVANQLKSKTELKLFSVCRVSSDRISNLTGWLKGKRPTV